MAILKQTGAQDAIMEVLAQGDLVEFEPECVYVQLCQEDVEPEELPSLRAGLALVAHITHFAHAHRT